jgi:hypothetical protein
MIDAWDGRIRRAFSPEGPANRPAVDRPNPTGEIADDDAADVGRGVGLGPLRLVFRPFDETIGHADRKKLVLTDRTAVADGRECIVLQQGDQTYWVDPKRSFLPLRYSRVFLGETVDQNDIHYTQDKDLGWIPTSWDLIRFFPTGSEAGKSGSKFSHTESGKVTEYKINSPIPESTFQLDIPPGTWVHDSIRKESYFVREGGKRRPVLRGEFNGKNFEQIRDSEPPSP